MFLNICDELVFLSYREIGLQSNENSHRSTFRYVYTLSGFFVISIATNEAFWLMDGFLCYIV